MWGPGERHPTVARPWGCAQGGVARGQEQDARPVRNCTLGRWISDGGLYFKQRGTYIVLAG
jgi:hypothetical protein